VQHVVQRSFCFDEREMPQSFFAIDRWQVLYAADGIAL
jgi:hypothetical protein